MPAKKLYYFKDKITGRKRNTAVVAPTAKAARAKLKRPAPARAVVYAVRTPTAAERRQIAAGRWVRTRANGSLPSKDKKRGFGPPRKR